MEREKTGELRYGSYLRIDELLRLQSPRSEPPHHEETLFIVVHQAIELWLKLLLHGLDEMAHSFERDDFRAATKLAGRGAEICRSLGAQVRTLETMSCLDFIEFRGVLEGASGFQSAQFRELETMLGIRDRIPVRLDLGGETLRDPYMGPLSPDERARVERRISEPDLQERFLATVDRHVHPGRLDRVFLADIIEEASDSDALVTALGAVATAPTADAPAAGLYVAEDSRRTLATVDLEKALAACGLGKERADALVTLACRRARLRLIYNRSRHRAGAGDTYEMWLLAENLVDMTEALSLFRAHHVRMVERMIGRRRGTGGSPGVSYLEKTLSYRPFAELWRVRTVL